MKLLYLIILMLFTTFSAIAQSQFGTTTFNKVPQSAVVYNLPFSDEAVSNALENKMKPYGKPKRSKDFLMYKDLQISEISRDPVTLYFNIEKKSKKDDNNATLTMMIADGTGQFYSSSDNANIFNNAKEFLNSFNTTAAAASLELLINGKNDMILKTNKKLKKLRDDSIDHENQKKKLEEKIETNKKDIEITEQDLSKQQLELDELIKKRKN